MADLVVKSVLKNNAREKSYVDFGGVRILMNSTVCAIQRTGIYNLVVIFIFSSYKRAQLAHSQAKRSKKSGFNYFTE